MPKTSRAYLIGQAMAKRAAGVGNVGMAGPSQAIPEFSAGGTPGGPIVLQETNPIGGAGASAPLTQSTPTATAAPKPSGIYMGGQQVSAPTRPVGAGVRASSTAGGPITLETGTGIYQGGSEAAAPQQKAPGIYVGGQQAGPAASGDGSSMSNLPNPTPIPTPPAPMPAPTPPPAAANPAPTSPSAPPPVTPSPAQAGATPRPSPAITASPATAGGAQPPIRPPIRGGFSRSAAYRTGQMMAKQAIDEKSRRLFRKIAAMLLKKAGIDEAELDGMEKRGIAFAALLPWLLGAAGAGAGAYGVHRYGEPRGWWESPALKAARDRLKAIQMAKQQGTDPVQMGLLQPKEKEEKDEPYWGSWGGYGGAGRMPRGLPKGYLGQEKRLQNLSKSLGLGLRHARAFSQLSKMPVF